MLLYPSGSLETVSLYPLVEFDIYLRQMYEIGKKFCDINVKDFQLSMDVWDVHRRGRPQELVFYPGWPKYIKGALGIKIHQAPLGSILLELEFGDNPTRLGLVLHIRSQVAFRCSLDLVKTGHNGPTRVFKYLSIEHKGHSQN
jgi:hypothetical protein